MNHILKEIDYCEGHAQYSPIKIYAGDVGVYSINCSVCLNEASKAAPARNLSRSKKIAKPLKEVIEAEQMSILPIRNS